MPERIYSVRLNKTELPMEKNQNLAPLGNSIYVDDNTIQIFVGKPIWYTEKDFLNDLKEMKNEE